jgi:hypothetical protein
MTCPLGELALATQSAVTFDNQKNRHKGDSVGHNTSGHTVACPTRTLGRRIAYIRRNGGTATTPLCAFKQGNRWKTVSSSMVTAMLRTSATLCPEFGLRAVDIQARSLRSGGAMALLCGDVPTDIIKLVGRWRSDSIFEYLHAQALPITRRLASTMLRHGAFILPDGAFEPIEARHIINNADIAANNQPAA